MNIFQKKLSTKKLPFKEMWELYRTLESGLSDKSEKYLFNEILNIIQKISTYDFKQSLRILYGDEFYIGKNPGDFANMFVDGLTKTNFFSFSNFIKTLHGNS